MGGNVVELNSSSFESFIAKGKSVIDLYTLWCGPCKIMAPKFEEAAKEMKGQVSFGKIDLDNNYEISQQYKVMSVPTTLFFKDGEVAHVSVGALTKDQIINIIKEYL